MFDVRAGHFDALDSFSEGQCKLLRSPLADYWVALAEASVNEGVVLLHIKSLC